MTLNTQRDSPSVVATEQEKTANVMLGQKKTQNPAQTKHDTSMHVSY